MNLAIERDASGTLVTAGRLAIFAIVCALLYWGQVVLIPLTLAGLVAFVLGPLVARLNRWGMPRIASVFIVTGIVTGMLGGIGYVVVGELSVLAGELPTYRDNIRDKIADVRALTRGGVLERVQTTIEGISEDIEREVEAEGSAETSDADEGEPVRVAVEPQSPLLGNAELLGPVLQAVATAGLVLLLSMFMLVRREDLRNRFVSLAGQTSLVTTTKAFAEAGKRISRYLLMQFVINATMGIAVWLGLFLIGVPYSALWGLAAAVLRYIPYVGPWIAALLPISLSLMTTPEWTQVGYVVALFVLLELFSNNVMEPLLYGHSVGLSPIAVIIAVIFWTWLWGPVGLVLATPLTASIVVLGKYIPGLAVLVRLLGEEPALQSHLWLYQRLLARDEDEAGDIVDQYRAEHTLEQTCDELLVGALTTLRRDLAGNRIGETDGEFVASALRELADELSDESPPVDEPGERVLLVGFPPRDALDEVALHLLRAMLVEQQCELEILSPDRLVGERLAEVEQRKPAAVCVVSLPPGDLATTKHACKRLRARDASLKIFVARLEAQNAPARSRDLLQAAGATLVTETLEELRDALLPVLRAAREHTEDAAAVRDLGRVTV